MPVQLQKQTTGQHLRLWREGKESLLAVVYSWMLSQVADKCEITPGEEFRVALDEACKVGPQHPLFSLQLTSIQTYKAAKTQKYCRLGSVSLCSQVGAKISLGDRLVSITLARTWAALSTWEKTKFIFELLWVGLAVPAKEINAIMDSMTEVWTCLRLM